MNNSAIAIASIKVTTQKLRGDDLCAPCRCPLSAHTFIVLLCHQVIYTHVLVIAQARVQHVKYWHWK